VEVDVEDISEVTAEEPWTSPLEELPFQGGVGAGNTQGLSAPVVVFCHQYPSLAFTHKKAAPKFWCGRRKIRHPPNIYCGGSETVPSQLIPSPIRGASASC
jgi:hypothetical protein